MFEAATRLAERALRDEPPSEEEARRILDGDGFELLPVLHAAFIPRERVSGRLWSMTSNPKWNIDGASSCALAAQTQAMLPAHSKTMTDSG